MRTGAQKMTILGYYQSSSEKQGSKWVVPFGSWGVDKYNWYYSVAYSRSQVIWGVWSN